MKRILSLVNGRTADKDDDGPEDVLYVYHEFHVVGESHYQDNLEKIAGPKAHGGVRRCCTADLVPEDDNPYDMQAVAVHIDGLKVGYLSRTNAPMYRRIAYHNDKIICEALIVGGWKRTAGDLGQYSVRLAAKIF